MKIEVKDKIAKKLQKRVDDSDEFKNIEEYVEYILKQVVERLEEESGSDKEEAYSEEDEEKVKERLKALGYLD